MKVLLINNDDGGGFADYIEIEAGTTVGKLFEQRRIGPFSRLFDSRQPPAVRPGAGADGRRSCFDHADQNRRRHPIVV